MTSGAGRRKPTLRSEAVEGSSIVTSCPWLAGNTRDRNRDVAVGRKRGNSPFPGALIGCRVF